MAGNDWMGLLDGFKRRRPITRLVIPGTHDSGAYEYAYTPMVRAQSLSIRQQLDAGVRALDLRVGVAYFANTYWLYHGPVNLDVSVQSAITDVVNFLTANPTETVIIMLKQETGNNDISAAINLIVNQTLGAMLLRRNDRRLSWPSQEECAGRALVFSRLRTPHADHYDTRGWNADSADMTVNVGGDLRLRIQDLYGSPRVRDKNDAIRNSLHNAEESEDPKSLFLNFTSFVWKPYEPLKTGPDTNNHIRMTHLTGKGVVCVDAADATILNYLVGLN
ncbi:Phosphatidylinositol diacylglycerol-lyase [Cystobacter fuscus DSM 2262]|uniref:1-phosphatidylinositol phosphodiesterase n=1 Tax=Cystobacter fuscus (strain ATCC 25194 / DSM 2262 / NBRC 100088 / M29) TaxID=1242864 RepID=S9P7H0_CYSF2|nr:phosphatidylinositol-specific phospholipase C domain-containing protein [Cystobacter fuscus]EPX58147.1 Phosphatidylinositol diacylglycerol-lyase [Cystobacter fuscus DSM 2262]